MYRKKKPETSCRFISVWQAQKSLLDRRGTLPKGVLYRARLLLLQDFRTKMLRAYQLLYYYARCQKWLTTRKEDF